MVWGRRDFSGGCYVCKTPIAVVVIKRAGAGAKNENIGLRVVVVITGDCGCGASCSWFRKRTGLCLKVSKLAFIVAQQPLSIACYVEQVEISIEITIKEQYGAGGDVFDCSNRRISQVT